MDSLALKMGVDALNLTQRPNYSGGHQPQSMITHDVHRTLFGEKQSVVVFDPIFVSWQKHGVWHYDAIEPVVECEDYSTWYKCGYRHYQDQDATMRKLWGVIHSQEGIAVDRAA